jgi:hypothetical protein
MKHTEAMGKIRSDLRKLIASEGANSGALEVCWPLRGGWASWDASKAPKGARDF